MDEFIIVPHAGINITGIGLIFYCCEFWWQQYVGDFMTAEVLRCLCQNHYVGDFFQFKKSHQLLKSVNIISNLSPTQTVSNIRHQHRCIRVFNRQNLTHYEHLVHSRYIFSIRFPLFILLMLLKKFIETIKFAFL